MNTRLKRAIETILERRADQMLTLAEWDELHDAFFLATGINIEYRTLDELRTEGT